MTGRSLIAGVAGLLIGAGAMSVSMPETVTPISSAPTTVTTPSPGPPSTQGTPTTVFSKPLPPDRGVALVWSPQRLPDDIDTAVAAVSGVGQVIQVHAGSLYATDILDENGRRRAVPSPGWLVPLEAFAIDPANAPAGLEGLEDGVGYLSQSSADLRGIGVGGVIVLSDGTEISIIGIVADSVLGAPELIVTDSTAGEVGAFEPRFLLFEFEGESGSIERDVRAVFPTDLPVRFRGPGETSYLRHADAVLPQVVIKQIFGEFTINSPTTDPFEVDPVWFDTQIVTQQLPLVGSVTCHRSVMPLLEQALIALAEADQDLIDPAGFEGCWNPRFVSGSQSISRHAWGVAFDINYSANPTGSGAAMDPAVVETLAALGFTWGGDWLVPDPAHFEWVGR